MEGEEEEAHPQAKEVGEGAQLQAVEEVEGVLPQEEEGEVGALALVVGVAVENQQYHVMGEEVVVGEVVLIGQAEVEGEGYSQNLTLPYSQGSG